MSATDRPSERLHAGGYPLWQALELDDISREEARREIARHDVEGGFEAFLAEVGDRERYYGHEVLEWLGY